MPDVTERIGFIGLGLMGREMARNVVGKGYPLAVMAHRNRKLIDDLVKRSAVEADSPKDLASRSTIVVTVQKGLQEQPANTDRAR
jgi:3-hydroxyisobutyrate dehydrogenase-like beta-hydroxyacid dehydrogenase